MGSALDDAKRISSDFLQDAASAAAGQSRIATLSGQLRHGDGQSARSRQAVFRAALQIADRDDTHLEIAFFALKGDVHQITSRISFKSVAAGPRANDRIDE
jgi:hypothetical protein